MAVVGTRPEVIKMAPVVRALRADRRFETILCATAQHRELADAMMSDFGLTADHDFDVMRPGQSLTGVLSRAACALDKVLERGRFDLALAQGDTTSVLATALAAFHRRVAVGHVEAGLRSFDRKAPFPEEANRVLVDHVADLHFAPTAQARRNLLREGISPGSIYVTGNTAVDALRWALDRKGPWPACLGGLEGPLAVVTLHRRESFGRPLEGILRSINEAARRRPELTWVYPVHPNPLVRAAAKRLLRHPRVRLVEPMGYLDFVRLLSRSELIVTDSGGIQEEAPTLGKPVLVMRDKTERGEALRAGMTRLVGASGERLLAALERLPRRGRPRPNPFGDGQAARRIVEAVAHWAGLGPRPRDFRCA